MKFIVLSASFTVNNTFLVAGKLLSRGSAVQQM